MAETPQKPPKLIVVQAFDRDDEGNLLTVFGPEQNQTEERAVRTAKLLATQHTGVIAWSREANPDVGEYGEPVVLFQAGDMSGHGVNAKNPAPPKRDRP